MYIKKKIFIQEVTMLYSKYMIEQLLTEFHPTDLMRANKMLK